MVPVGVSLRLPFFPFFFLQRFFFSIPPFSFMAQLVGEGGGGLGGGGVVFFFFFFFCGVWGGRLR